eukprot:SAG31_NODE_2370_length_5852_cov_2.750391_7_plen_78_part_00
MRPLVGRRSSLTVACQPQRRTVPVQNEYGALPCQCERAECLIQIAVLCFLQYKLREERLIKPETFANVVASTLYEKR